MITATEARKLAENYAWSKQHFLDEVLTVVENNSKIGLLKLDLHHYCKYHEGFRLEYLDEIKGLGYLVTYDESFDILTLEW